ncbi:AMP-binding protein, partial [Desulfocastanea catecholica]
GGFIASPFNPRLQADELEYLVNYSEAKVLFIGPEMVNQVKTLQDKLPKVQVYITLEEPAEGMIFHQNLLETDPKEEPNVDVAPDDP